MITEPVAIAIVSAISGIVVAYIVNVVAVKVQTKKASKQPKDRMEQMFDGYERLINAKDLEDQRKAKLIHELQDNIDKMEEELRTTKALLTTTQNELIDSNIENKELKEMLEVIRREYSHMKKQAKEGKL